MNKKPLIYPIIAACLLLAGCAGEKDTRPDVVPPSRKVIVEQDLFTLEDITKAFSEQGINLRKANEPIPQQLRLNGKTPAVFQSEYTDEIYYFIWVYDSIEDRTRALSEGIQNYSDKEIFKGKKISFSYGLTAKNVLAAYLFEERIDRDVLNEQNKIEETVLEKLNDIKQIIFEGQGENWEAKIIVKYFEYYWQDKNGATHKEQYHQKYPVLKYKGNTPEKVGRISYAYEDGYSRISASGDFLDKDGYVYGGKGAGVELRPQEDDVYTITIKWNEEQETFKMMNRIPVE